MYCLAKWTQGFPQIPVEPWAWKVTLRPQQREAPLNRTGPTTPHPITIQLCLYKVAAHPMTLLSRSADTPTQNYPHLAEEDMPVIQQSFFGTLECLQQAHPHFLELKWIPPRGSPTCPRSRDNSTTPARTTNDTPLNTSTGTHTRHQGKRAQSPDAVLIAHRTQHAAPAPAVRDPLLSATSVPSTSGSTQDPPPSPTSGFSASDSTTSTTTSTSSSSTTTSSSSIAPPKPRAKSRKRARKSVPTAGAPATAKAPAA